MKEHYLILFIVIIFKEQQLITNIKAPVGDNQNSKMISNNWFVFLEDIWLIEKLFAFKK